MSEYWNRRYEVEGRIWGDAPSSTAVYALEHFRREGVRRLLVPGSGYGRNTRLFSSAGMVVTGIEPSATAVKLAQEFDPTTEFLQASVFDVSLGECAYDGIYCFNVLHLFRREERRLFLDLCRKALRERGLAFFTVFSEIEPSFGTGEQVEENTFESKPGRPVHYFTEDDLLASFSAYDFLSCQKEPK